MILICKTTFVKIYEKLGNVNNGRFISVIVFQISLNDSAGFMNVKWTCY
jgi:hypothetical protein